MLLLMHLRFLPCWWVLFFFFLTCIVCLCHFLVVRACASSSTLWPLVHWFEFLLIHFKNGHEYLIMRTSSVFIYSTRFLLLSFISRSLSFVWDTLFLFFLSSPFFDGFSFHYYEILVIIFFSERSHSFFIWQFYSFCYLYFSTFHNEHGTFFNTKFYSYILPVFPYFLYKILKFFFIDPKIVWNLCTCHRCYQMLFK